MTQPYSLSSPHSRFTRQSASTAAGMAFLTIGRSSFAIQYLVGKLADRQRVTWSVATMATKIANKDLSFGAGGNSDFMLRPISFDSNDAFVACEVVCHAIVRGGIRRRQRPQRLARQASCHRCCVSDRSGRFQRWRGDRLLRGDPSYRDEITFADRASGQGKSQPAQLLQPARSI